MDYRSWAAYLTEQLKKRGFSEGIVLDLGCGTGTMTELLAEAGVNASIDQVDWQTWLSDVYQGRSFEAIVIGFDAA